MYYHQHNNEPAQATRCATPCRLRLAPCPHACLGPLPSCARTQQMAQLHRPPRSCTPSPAQHVKQLHDANQASFCALA